MNELETVNKKLKEASKDVRELENGERNWCLTLIPSISLRRKRSRTIQTKWAVQKVGQHQF